jgi:hypothetical protein
VAITLRGVDVELEPEQPAEVVRTVEELLTDSRAAPDPWWQAGIQEATES